MKVAYSNLPRHLSLTTLKTALTLAEYLHKCRFVPTPLSATSPFPYKAAKEMHYLKPVQQNKVVNNFCTSAVYKRAGD